MLKATHSAASVADTWLAIQENAILTKAYMVCPRVSEEGTVGNSVIPACRYPPPEDTVVAEPTWLFRAPTSTKRTAAISLMVAWGQSIGVRHDDACAP